LPDWGRKGVGKFSFNALILLAIPEEKITVDLGTGGRMILK
jgi:hypothetical protein